MGWKVRAVIVGATVAAVGVAGAGLSGAALAQKRSAPTRTAPTRAPQVGPITGPIATYWVSAATSSGFGAGLMAGGGRPSMGAMMGMLTGSGNSPDAANHSLTLQLGSTQSPTGEPQAEHRPPPGLGVGATLPLVTPQPARQTASTPTQSEPGDPESYQRPKGRLLIFWGCGEHAGPGQPLIFDFATIGTGAPLPDLGGTVRVNVEHPPAYGRVTTYGHWPNERRSPPVPATGSLVGPHLVKSDYAPDISFDVPPELDFMPALGMAVSPSVEGGKRITWRPAPTATGYYLQLIGANGAQGGARGSNPNGGADMVFWASSTVKPGFFGGGLADYLPPEEVRRLVVQRAILAPETAECVVPAEVAQAAPMGLVTGIAYGPEQVFTDPPRPNSGPWNIRWRTKVRLKSTATLLLGMPGMGGRGGRDQGPPPPPPSAGDRARSILKNLRPF